MFFYVIFNGFDVKFEVQLFLIQNIIVVSFAVSTLHIHTGRYYKLYLLI